LSKISDRKRVRIGDMGAKDAIIRMLSSDVAVGNIPLVHDKTSTAPVD
jgi:hypothetical protein